MDEIFEHNDKYFNLFEDTSSQDRDVNLIKIDCCLSDRGTGSFWSDPRSATPPLVESPSFEVDGTTSIAVESASA